MKSILVGVTCMMAAACAHTQAASADAAPQTQPAKTEQAAISRPAQAPVQNTLASGQAELDKALSELKNVTVLFAFDSATLSKEAENKLANVGAVLAKYPALKVRIEGNCDERGSEQYNLALGQRRAEAARKYLARMGVQDGQLTAVSFGAEKPRVAGHDEQAWSQNRRDELDAQR